jgi:hypothetical protein
MEIILILLVLLICAAFVVGARFKLTSQSFCGGAPRAGRAPARARRPTRAAKNIVVDTLNLAHWLRERADKGPLSTAEITAAIERAAPALRKRFPGEIVFVLKDHNNTLNDGAVRAQYQAAAERARVRIVCAERYSPGAEPAFRRARRPRHSAAGRDDFYMCLLASKLRCAVATEDRLRDFAEFRGAVAPFIIVTFAHWRALPGRDFVRPDARAFARLRRPRRVGFEELGIGA